MVTEQFKPDIVQPDLVWPQVMPIYLVPVFWENKDLIGTQVMGKRDLAEEKTRHFKSVPSLMRNWSNGAPSALNHDKWYSQIGTKIWQMVPIETVPKKGTAVATLQISFTCLTLKLCWNILVLAKSPSILFKPFLSHLFYTNIRQYLVKNCR